MTFSFFPFFSVAHSLLVPAFPATLLSPLLCRSLPPPPLPPSLLTPSALLQYPHVFPALSLRLSPSLLFPLNSLTTLTLLFPASATLSLSPSLSPHSTPNPSLPPSLPPLLPPGPSSSTHYFLRFSNMLIHRMQPPVSLQGCGEDGGGVKAAGVLQKVASVAPPIRMTLQYL